MTLIRLPLGKTLLGAFSRIGATVLVASTVSACGADTSNAADASATAAVTAPEAKLHALLDKTRKNLRFVDGGTFQMGDFGPLHSPDKLFYSSNPNNKPLHKVTLDSFSMSAFKTTYADHDVYSEATGRPLVGMDELTRKRRLADVAAGLNWQQARDYCRWLGQKLKLPMDLPTEAQWEYAARNRGQFFLFATDNGNVDEGRNVWEFEQRRDYVHRQNLGVYNPSLPLGQFPPTPLGLYDMITDGLEWTLDWYDEQYYADSLEKNPLGPKAGIEKVLRSSRGSSGAALAFGDGMTINRAHRAPDPPKIDSAGNPAPGRNMTSDTTARCAINSPIPTANAR